jgi:hypothetical protein
MPSLNLVSKNETWTFSFKDRDNVIAGTVFNISIYKSRSSETVISKD